MDYMPYMNLITSEHRNSPRFMAWVKFLIGLFDVDVERSFQTLFNVQTSAGNQLDIIGELVGTPRAFPPLSELPGYPPVLPDETYRRLIQAKIVRNQFKGQQGTLPNLWESVFETDIQALVSDNQDMTMDVELIGGYSPLDMALVLHGYIVPKPLGVGVKVNMTTDIQAETFGIGHAITNTAKIWILPFYPDPDMARVELNRAAILGAAYGKIHIGFEYPDPNPVSTEVFAGGALGSNTGVAEISMTYNDPDAASVGISAGVSPLAIGGIIAIKNYDPGELSSSVDISYGCAIGANTATITIPTSNRPGGVGEV